MDIRIFLTAVVFLLVANFILFFGFYQWDMYMKLCKKSLITKRFIRFFVVHYGYYLENPIYLSEPSFLILPDDKNRYSVSKIILILELCCFIYSVTCIVLACVQLAIGNTSLGIWITSMAACYCLFAIVFSIVGAIKAKKMVNRRNREKWRKLVEGGIKNNVSIPEFCDVIKKKSDVSFKVYDVTFAFEIYQYNREKAFWRIKSLTHDCALFFNGSIETILATVHINGKSLKELWPYVGLSSGDE